MLRNPLLDNRQQAFTFPKHAEAFDGSGVLLRVQIFDPHFDPVVFEADLLVERSGQVPTVKEFSGSLALL